MFNVKKKIKKGNAYVVIFESAFGYYYYGKNFTLKFLSNYHDEDNTDIVVMEHFEFAQTYKELFYCFDKTEDMTIFGIYVYELNSESEIVNQVELKTSNAFLSKLKAVKKYMIKENGFPFYDSYFTIPPKLKLSPSEIAYINCCYPDFITRCKDSFFHNSVLASVRMSDEFYIFPEHLFGEIGKYASEGYSIGIVEDKSNRYCYMVLAKIEKNNFLKMKLSVKAEIMDHIRSIDKR